MLPKIYLAKSLQKCKDKWNQETLKRQLSRSENRKWKWKKLGKLTFPKIIMFCKKNLGNILIDKAIMLNLLSRKMQKKQYLKRLQSNHFTKNVSLKLWFFLVRIFPYSDWILRDTSYLSVFSPNEGKYGPEKIPYLDTFHAVDDLKKINH